MAELFLRSAALNVGGILLDMDPQDSRDPSKTLKFTFDVTRTLKKDPNQASISIFNLNEANRAKLQEKDVPVTIEAGYKDNRSIIFAGTLDYSQSVLNGTDWITSLESGDGSKNIRTARINKSFAPGAVISGMMEEITDALGVGIGNLKKKLSEGGLRGPVSGFLNGAVLTGKAAKQFTKIMDKYGYSWSIQNGELLVLGPTDTIEKSAVKITRDTGLIGSPEQGDKGYLTFNCLLQPEITPGRELFVESKQIKGGFYKAETVNYKGDTHGNDWTCTIEARPIS